jgi:hypothetical protein
MATLGSDPAQAARLLGAAERFWERTYGRPQFGSPALTAAWQACEQQIRAAICDAAHEAAYSAGRADGTRAALDAIPAVPGH